MFHCKPLSIVPIDSNLEGDTVLLPAQIFAQLFNDEFGGGILGIRITSDEVATYASCAPQSVDDNVYMPDWMLSSLRERSMKFEEDLMVDVEVAGLLPYANTIRVRRVETGIEADLQQLLQEFLYDCKYIQPGTVFHLPCAGSIIDMVVESVIDEEGFEMEVGQLGAEVCLDIQEPASAPPEPESEDPGPCPMIANHEEIPYARPLGYVMPAMVFIPSTVQSTPIHSIEELRRHRIAFFSSCGGGPANEANRSGQYSGAGNS